MEIKEIITMEFETDGSNRDPYSQVLTQILLQDMDMLREGQGNKAWDKWPEEDRVFYSSMLALLGYYMVQQDLDDLLPKLLVKGMPGCG